MGSDSTPRDKENAMLLANQREHADQWRPWLYALLAGSLALRLFFALIWHGSVEWTDAVGYHQLALNLLHDGTFPSALRPPGYSALVAAHYAIFGERQEPVYLVQALAGTLGVLIVYRLAVELLSDRRRGLALLSATLYGLSPGVAFYAGWLLREAFATLYAPLLIWLWLRMVQRSWRYALPLGLLTGAAAYVRSDSVVVVAALVVLAILCPVWRRRALLGGLVAGGLAAACVAPWVVYCATTRGYANMDLAAPPVLFAATWHLAPSGDVEAEFRSYVLDQVARENLPPQDQRTWHLSKMLANKLPRNDVRAEVDLYKKMGRVAGENIRRHPGDYLRTRVRELWFAVAGEPFLLWRDRETPSVAECLREHYWGTLALKVFNYVIWPLVVLPLAGFGLICALRQRDACVWPLGLALTAVAVLILLICLVHAEPRYRVPYDSVLYTSACLGGAALLRKVAARESKKEKRVGSLQ